LRSTTSTIYRLRFGSGRHTKPWPGRAANAIGSEETIMKGLVRYRACLCLLGTALSLLSSPVSAQQPIQGQKPTQAQIDAVRHSCSGDYQTYCQTVPMGGPESFNCLMQNMPRLTGRCHEAMGALSGGATAGGSATPPAPPPPQR
jgi:hypothetical protein